MQFLKVDDAVLHYAMIGAGPDKPAIVFINALGTDFRIWRDVVVRLVGNFTILTYDKRGHGLSDTGEGAVTIERHAEDLAALMDHLGLRSAFICGLSVGGLVAQQLYADRRDLVAALTLCATAAKVGDAGTWNGRIAAVEAGGIEALAEGTLERWFSETFRTGRSEELAGYHNMLVRQSPRGYIATCAALRDADLTREARQIAVPTLCISGEKDGSIPAGIVADLAKSIPGARYETIKDAAHILPVENGELLSSMILAFADGVLRRSALN